MVVAVPVIGTAAREAAARMNARRSSELMGSFGCTLPPHIFGLYSGPVADPRVTRGRYAAGFRYSPPPSLAPADYVQSADAQQHTGMPRVHRRGHSELRLYELPPVRLGAV